MALLLVERFSIELAPTALLKAGSGVARLLPVLPAGTRVYLPSLPGDPPDAIEQSIALLRRSHDGLVPVPHIPAQRVASLATLEQQLSRWQRTATDGVLREALIVRGDAHGHNTADSVATAAAASNAPPFPDSLALLETDVLQRHGFDAVSLCGHPEGVGDLSADAARLALTRKLEWAAGAGVAPRVVTQFCFDATTTTRFVDELRRGGAAGASAPVSLGVVGPTKRPMRSRMAERCGVRPPPPARANAGGDEDDGWPGEYIESLERWQASSGAAGAAVELHVYPFGGLRRTLDWLGV